MSSDVWTLCVPGAGRTFFVWRPTLARAVASADARVACFALDCTHGVLLPLQAAADEAAWDVKAAERKRLGIGPPLKPTPENQWRLEQMYDDE